MLATLKRAWTFFRLPLPASAEDTVEKPVDILPERIDEARLSAGDVDAWKCFVDSLASHGFAAIQLGDAHADMVADARESGGRFMAERTEDEKRRFAPRASADPLLRGRLDHAGYRHFDGLKEFMKLHATDPEDRWPAEVADSWRRLLDADRTLLLEALCFVGRRDERISEAALDCIGRFAEQRSLLSYISYFDAVDHDKHTQHLDNDDPALEGGDGHGSADDDDVVVSDPHVDTGLLTAIVCSDVPGLQVWDRAHGTGWLAVEDMAGIDPGRTMLVIVGGKLSMFCTDSRDGRPAYAEPTRHRVVLPRGTARQSLVYMLDCPT